MASNIPTVRQAAWISIIPQLLIMGLLVYTFYVLGLKEPILYSALTYLILSFGLRNIIACSHRSGMRLVKQQKFEEAISYFEDSVDFFTKYHWLDKYRYLTLLSSSKMSYKEMGLCNIAFCHSQTGNGQKSKEYYEKTLKEFPENGLARAGLNMINSVERNNMDETIP